MSKSVCVSATNDTMCTLGQSVKIAHNQQNPHNNLNKISENHIQTSYLQISSTTHNPRNLRQEMRENMDVLCVNTVILKEGDN